MHIKNLIFSVPEGVEFLWRENNSLRAKKYIGKISGSGVLKNFKWSDREVVKKKFFILYESYNTL